jgi:hypothetical protein
MGSNAIASNYSRENEAEAGGKSFRHRSLMRALVSGIRHHSSSAIMQRAPRGLEGEFMIGLARLIKNAQSHAARPVFLLPARRAVACMGRGDGKPPSSPASNRCWIKFGTTYATIVSQVRHAIESQVSYSSRTYLG